MENTIQQILAELKAEATAQQKENILKMLNMLSLQNVGHEHLTMFINHLLVLFARIEKGEMLEMEGVREMMSELKPESTDKAREVAQILGENISESEIFLVATHIENLINQQR
ncbi:MAG: PRD domain-containing protein [Alphaproteobacteria bacterium]|jgi:hypothetical protein|nr:PRD domain-containing protein [Alphaproteobacteria bacterium]